MKWLAAATVAIVVVLFVLWRQLNKSDAAPLPEESVTKPTAPVRDRGDIAMPQPAAVPEAGSAVPTEAADPTPSEASPTKKLDPAGDEYFYKFIEAIPKKTTANAAKCYEGIAKRLHRNQKLSLKFTAVIKDGVVSMKDVSIKENTLNNAALENCFIAEVQRTTWKDDSLPDGEYPDELVLRPERGMKKYSKENIEYVGEEAPPIDRQ
jgi:hypothetical protein